LKVVCDEIFGRLNFVANAVWQKKYTVANDARWLSDNHDHILVYAKSKLEWKPNRLPRSDEMNARYSNPDNHPKGPWKATPLHAKSGSAAGRDFSYTFRNGLVWSPPPGTFPRFSTQKLAEMDDGNEIWFGRDGSAAPSRKTFLAELKADGPPSATLWLHTEVGHNHEAREEVKAFNPQDPFATPKPEKLLQRIVHLASDPGDLVLDSFAGSGTTGAVAHKMGRRWIMVEIGEHADTHVLPRLQKVIDGTDQGGISKAVDWKGGGGFRYFTLAPSLLSQDKYGNWVIAKDYNPAMLAEAMCKHMGFAYAPSSDPQEYWLHGSSTETDFIYVTTQSLTYDACAKIAHDVGPDRSLLICCKAYDDGADAFENLTMVKIPTSILQKCEWGRDDYSLNIQNLPMAEDDAAEEAPSTDGLPLFGGENGNG
jgi:adenine-specific DNA-methyltransferase